MDANEACSTQLDESVSGPLLRLLSWCGVLYDLLCSRLASWSSGTCALEGQDIFGNDSPTEVDATELWQFHQCWLIPNPCIESRFQTAVT